MLYVLTYTSISISSQMVSLLVLTCDWPCCRPKKKRTARWRKRQGRSPLRSFSLRSDIIALRIPKGCVHTGTYAAIEFFISNDDKDRRRRG